jgi:hypothetical protein
MDRQTDMMKLVVALCSFVNAFKNELCGFHGSGNLECGLVSRGVASVSEERLPLVVEFVGSSKVVSTNR